MGQVVTDLLFGSVVGPAVTFRIRHNEQNLSLADVTQQAGKYHSILGPRLSLTPNCDSQACDNASLKYFQPVWGWKEPDVNPSCRAGEV